MRDGEIDATIYRTRKERQARDRKIKRRTYRIYLRQAWILSIATGLSINSLMLSHRMQGTEAMLTSQATTAVSFSAVDHFQGWYKGLVDQVSSNYYEGHSVLKAMQGYTDSDVDSSHHHDDQRSHLHQLQCDGRQIQLFYTDAQRAYLTIAQAVTKDEDKAQASPIDSLQRVARWGRYAQEKASRYLEHLQKDLSRAQKIVNSQATADDDQSDDHVANHFAVSKFDQVAGGSSGATSKGTVTGVVYGNDASSAIRPDTVMVATYTVSDATYAVSNAVYTVMNGTYIAQNELGQTLLPNVP